MNVFGIFVKQPVPGRVKTRLAADLGAEQAAELYAAFIADLSERFCEIADRRFLCYWPENDSAKEYFRQLVGTRYNLWPQPDVSLGERMACFFGRAFASGAKQAVLIGSDSPTLPQSLVNEAFRALENHDCVLGPATDGGYYLIGQSRQLQQVFDEIEWSSARVLAQTVAHIEQSGARLALLSPWYDVDTIEDLEHLRGHIRALQIAGTPINLAQTIRALRETG